MDEVAGLPTPEPMLDPAAEPTVVAAPPARLPRRKLSRWLALGLVVSLGLVIAGVILLSRANQAHHAATKERAAAAAELKSRQSDTFASKASLGQTRADAGAADQALAPVLATVQQLGQLGQQGTAAAGDLQHAGETVGGSVDAYNSLVDKANALTDQWNSTLTTLDDQMSKLPPT